MDVEKNFTLNQKKELVAVGKALSSEVRIDILNLLSYEQLNVNEIAERMKIPASSAAMNVNVLEEAGLIRTELKPGIRGSKKVCIKQVRNLSLNLMPSEKEQKSEVISMPIGNYVDYKVQPTCGMVSADNYIDEEDEPRCFYNPQRTNAKLLWFCNGYVEYRFPNHSIQNAKLQCVELSAELCSEAPDYDLNCPSDITVWINEIDAGTWSCPSDFGGRRGKLNPDWWQDKNSQYGNLKVWHIDQSGTYINGEKMTNIPLSNYHLANNPYISVRIGIKEDAVHKGGINIFGDCFGDYPQNILLKLNY